MIHSSVYSEKKFNRYIDNYLTGDDWSLNSSDQVMIYRAINDIKLTHTLDEEIYKHKYIKLFETECPICLEAITTRQDSCITDCNHVFHKSCMTIFLSLDENKLCPMCRFDLFDCDTSEHLICGGLLYGGDRYKQHVIDDYFENPKYKYMFSPRECWKGRHLLGRKVTCSECLEFRRIKDLK